MSSGDKKIVVVSLEGGIASGKSTVLRNIQNHMRDWIVVPERVSTWQGKDQSYNSSERTNVLQAFYENPQKNAHTLQTLILHTRIHDMQKAIRESFQRSSERVVIVTERSLASDRLFAENAFRSGNMTDHEWYVYNVMWKDCMDVIGPYLKGSIVLDVDGETSMRRIVKRSREEEGKVDIGYLNGLLETHESVFPRNSERAVWVRNRENDIESTVESVQKAVECLVTET